MKFPDFLHRLLHGILLVSIIATLFTLVPSSTADSNESTEKKGLLYTGGVWLEDAGDFVGNLFFSADVIEKKEVLREQNLANEDYEAEILYRFFQRIEIASFSFLEEILDGDETGSGVYYMDLRYSSNQDLVN